jgi:hypothetical protein
MLITQIAVTMDNENNETLYALNGAGFLFVKQCVTKRFPTPENPYACKHAYYWEPVDLPIGKPAEFLEG